MNSQLNTARSDEAEVLRAVLENLTEGLEGKISLLPSIALSSVAHQDRPSIHIRLKIQ